MDFTTKDIDQQVHKILSSPDFRASRQLSTLFKYIIEETVAGRAEDIKAYTIAIEAFKRESSIDTQIDPFVRVLASRLRRVLDHYYHSIGKSDPIRIDIPKGAYVPIFSYQKKTESDNIQSLQKGELQKNKFENSSKEARSDKVFQKKKISYLLLKSSVTITFIIILAIVTWLFIFNAEEETPLTNIKPTVIVFPFENITGTSDEDFFIHNISAELSNHLSLFEDISVIAYYSARKMKEKEEDIFISAANLGVGFAVTGSVNKVNDELRVSAQLIDISTKRQLWGETFKRMLTSANIFDVETEISNRIAGEIGGTYGVVNRKINNTSLGKRETELTVYEAIAIFRAYGYAPSIDLYQKALRSLQKAVNTDSKNALAWAMLGNLYLDAYTLSISDIEQPFEKGSICINKAVQLDPEEQFVRSIEAFMYHLRGERNQALETLEISTSLNPNNGFLVGVNGWNMVLLGEFEKGLSIMERGIKLNPYYPSYFHLAYFLDHLHRGKFEQALNDAERLNLPNLFWDPLLRTIALTKLGRLDEAKVKLQEVIELRPDFEQRTRFYIKCYIFPDELVDEIIESLKLAGLRMENSI